MARNGQAVPGQPFRKADIEFEAAAPGLIPVTVPELLGQLHGTVIPDPCRDRVHRVAWTLWRRPHQYQAPANPPALARLRRRGASTLTTITTVNDGG
jgi:hypothetical protein